MTDIHTIAEFAKNNVETLRVALVEYEGYRLCDVRILADHAGAHGERQPTCAGICFRIGLLPDLIAALRAAEEASR